MPSPFPGMNPYLEQEFAWHDFHNRFVIGSAEAIGVQVRPAFIVKIDVNVFIEEPEVDGRRVVGRPDAYVAEISREPHLSLSSVAVAEPTRAVIVPAIEPESDPFIEIRDLQDRKL